MIRINDRVRLTGVDDEFCRGMLSHEWIVVDIFHNKSLFIKSTQNPEFVGLITCPDGVERVDIMQPKIDELQNRIDEAIFDLQHIEDAMWAEQVEHVLMVLSGSPCDTP